MAAAPRLWPGCCGRGGGHAARGSTVVCVLTGHGLKDPEWAMRVRGRPPTVKADPEAVAAELGL